LLDCLAYIVRVGKAVEGRFAMARSKGDKVTMTEFLSRLAIAKATRGPVIHFTSRVTLPKNDSRRKTGKYMSLPEACKMIGIHPRTYARHEGGLFPKAKRLDSGFRAFTKEEVKELRKIWMKRSERWERRRKQLA
jgi:predicted DNA-binding transcriptional regulator AlpA